MSLIYQAPPRRPGASFEVEAIATASEEVGAYQSWLMMLLDRMELSSRSSLTTSWVMGVHAVLFVSSPEAQELSVEAPPFFPSQLRTLWEQPAWITTRLAPSTFPFFTRRVRVEEYPPLEQQWAATIERRIASLGRLLSPLERTALRQSYVVSPLPSEGEEGWEVWEGGGVRGISQKELRECARLCREEWEARDARSLWCALHLQRMGLLLLREELQMAQVSSSHTRLPNSVIS